MDVQIDDHGRIVIPKEVRDRLGLKSGSALKLRVQVDEEAGGSITLEPKRPKPALRKSGELLVHTGELTEDGFDVVEQIRSNRRGRARTHAGLNRSSSDD
jgi:AbrB family looped-hinge helix DNA binding protein